jgi:hypothetical protein
MKNSVLTQTQMVRATGVRNPRSDCIQFDDDVCTPEEQQLDITRRKILKKLLARLGPANSFRHTFES